MRFRYGVAILIIFILLLCRLFAVKIPHEWEMAYVHIHLNADSTYAAGKRLHENSLLLSGLKQEILCAESEGTGWLQFYKLDDPANIHRVIQHCLIIFRTLGVKSCKMSKDNEQVKFHLLVNRVRPVALTFVFNNANGLMQLEKIEGLCEILRQIDCLDIVLPVQSVNIRESFKNAF